MNSMESEPFYIGYEAQAPVPLRRWLRAIVMVLLVMTMSAALLIAIGFHRLPRSVFEFGKEREYVGIILAQPYPSLLVMPEGTLEQYWLVGKGKHGAQVNDYLGQTVRLCGTLITRDGLRMLEISPSSLERLNRPTSPERLSVNIGRFTLVGEIVDSKCYLGVMNPGHMKPHRECAVRCISGGIPPLFLARDSQGETITLQLADTQGEPLSQQILDYVAEPIEITGEVTRQGEWLTLRADPATYRRK